MRTNFHLYFDLCFRRSSSLVLAVPQLAYSASVYTLYFTLIHFVAIWSRLCPRNGWCFVWTLQRGRRPVTLNKFLIFSGSTPPPPPPPPHTSFFLLPPPPPSPHHPRPSPASQPASQPVGGYDSPSVLDLGRQRNKVDRTYNRGPYKKGCP